MKRLLPCLALALLGCTSPPGRQRIVAWRSGVAEGVPELSHPPSLADVHTMADGIARVDALRLARDLEGSRWVCLRLLDKQPKNPALLWRAARAEADMVFVLKSRGYDSDQRDVAAASGLDYAVRARENAPDPSADLLAQLAWALGSTVHLLPMLDRDERAAKTKKVADEALHQDPDQVTALATLSILNLRLATLPWIASLFAGDAPEGTLQGAIDYARRCVSLEPSLFHHLLLARALAAADQPKEASAVLDQGLNTPGYRPRDAEVRGEVLELRDSLEQ